MTWVCQCESLYVSGWCMWTYVYRYMCLWALTETRRDQWVSSSITFSLFLRARSSPWPCVSSARLGQQEAHCLCRLWSRVSERWMLSFICGFLNPRQFLLSSSISCVCTVFVTFCCCDWTPWPRYLRGERASVYSFRRVGVRGGLMATSSRHSIRNRSGELPSWNTAQRANMKDVRILTLKVLPQWQTSSSDGGQT